MPTKKPAQPELRRAKRADWKALAKHRGEALTVMADVLRAEQKHLNDATARATHAERVRDEYLNRALAAEKHNAILLAEREARETGTVRKRPYCLLCYRIDCDGSCATNIAAPNTLEVSDCCKESLCRGGATEKSWQRLTSWAARWSIEIACAVIILAVFAVASWYALQWGK